MRPITRAARPARRQPALAILVAIAALLLTPALSSADVTIGAEGPSPSGWEFGTEPYDASAGQVVTAPAGITSLRSFTLWLQDPPAFSFRAYVYAWNGTGTTATGPALYESGDLHTAGESTYEAVSIATGGVDVTPGHQYVLFLSRSADQAADAEVAANAGIETAETFSMFEEIPPPYTEGKFVFLNNGYDTTGWTSRTWFEKSNSDARFEATFDVPAPVVTPPVEAVKTVTTKIGTPAVATAAPARCVVPDLGGMTLAAAKTALSAADCTLGKVQHHWFSIPSGELMEQNAHQGTVLPVGSKVGVWLSRGPHHRSRKQAR